MSTKPQIDLIKRHYANDENLRTRQDIHAHYTVPDRSFSDWVLQRLQWRGDERVLDMGCGPGLYYPTLKSAHPQMHYVGAELVPAMLMNHPARDHDELLMLADAQRLPYPDAAFDVVLANHMLHHVPDITMAVGELRRVLKPGGILLTATNSIQTMPELHVLMRRAIVLLTRNGAATVRAPDNPGDRYSLENGTRLLSQHFFAVVRHDLPSALVFPEVEPAMSYLESTRDLREPHLPEDVVWEDVMMIMRQQINQLIKHLGELVINKQSGVLIASDNGGFIADFVARKQGNQSAG